MLSECLGWLCRPIVGCLSCLFCDCLWCQCNCIIFPAPRNSGPYEDYVEGPVSVVYRHCDLQDSSIPYAEISTAKSRLSKRCFIYFHGNAEDISLVGHFLVPLVKALDITFLAIEYPRYSNYDVCCPALLSNRIKKDSLLFHDYLIREGRSVEDVMVMGRSIGSGGASYLAGHRKVPVLVLMSPFDSIRNVAMSMVGCAGCLIKQHFNNEQELVKFTGKLLVIHGQEDVVIPVQHGKNLVHTYNLGNPYKNMATPTYPRRMTHNSYDLDEDILTPIRDFLRL